MGDGKAKNVIEYLDYLMEKGKASNGAIRPLKVAFSRVMQVIEGDDWMQTDVRSIDIDDYMARFANLTMGKYTSESLTSYKSRANRAITWYIQFLDKPGWAPDVQARNRSVKTEIKKSAQTDLITGGAHINNPSTSKAAPQSHLNLQVSPTDQVSYPFPLSDGQLITISLPIKLSKKDAQRIGTFIESIAFEEQLLIGPGHE